MSFLRIKAPKTCNVTPKGALVRCTGYRDLENERNALVAQVEELKAQLVDAVGDGFYDGYLQCVNDAKNDHFDSYVINDQDILLLSERYESGHRYAKSMAHIRAKAVINFAEQVRDDYLSRVVPAELTTCDLFQTARDHVKESYQYESKHWDGN